MNHYEEKISRYFGGWERFGVKEDDGRITVIYPDAMPAVRLAMSPDDELFIGPDESVAAGYVLHDYLTEADLAKHKEHNGQWKPGRLVVETSPGSYQVWVVYENDLSKDQRAQITKTNVDEAPRLWARMTDDCRVVHLDSEDQEKLPAKSHKMDPIFEKLGKFFGEFEVGVYKEAEGEKEGAVWKTEADAGYLKAMNAQGKHIFVRPSFEREPYYMFHDDVDKEGLAKYHKDAQGKYKPGRLVVESSTGNYQVWIRSNRPLEIEEKKHWLDLMQSDPGASPKHRWGRCPGFRNRKEKYKTDQGYPLAKLVWIDWAKQAEIPIVQLPEKHIEPQPTPPREVGRSMSTGSSAGLPTRDDYYKGVDAKGKVRESEQDLAYAMALIRRGVPDHEVIDRISNERTEWGNHQGEKRKQVYLTRTLDRAHHYIGHSSYVITVVDKAKNRQRQVMVKDVPKKEAKQILAKRAEAEAVLLGFDRPEDLSITIEKPERKKKLATTKDKGVGLAFDQPGLCAWP